MEIPGIQINWTKPTLAKGISYDIEDFELMTTVLSALQYRKLYGCIKLYTDAVGFSAYERTGFLPLWDEIHLLSVPESVDPISFWAAGKLYALANETTPVCMIDTDFILWQPVDLSAAVTAAHFEAVGNAVYPSDLQYYRTGFTPFYRLDANADALNTAFCCFTDESFKQRYLENAFSFMEQADPCGNTLQYMVCAEQRILGMAAKETGMKPAVLLENGPFAPQKIATHTWGFKQRMRQDEKARIGFCVRLAKRIMTQWPEWGAVCRKIPKLERYFRLIEGMPFADV